MKYMLHVNNATFAILVQYAYIQLRVTKNQVFQISYIKFLQIT